MVLQFRAKSCIALSLFVAGLTILLSGTSLAQGKQIFIVGQLPDAVVGTSYSAALTVFGGVSPYHFSATGIPAGMSLNATTGSITGTPSQDGSFQMEVTVTDSGSNSGQAPIPLKVATAGTVSVEISPPAVTMPSGGTQQFSATVSNTASQAVTWATTKGAISSSGFFTAPQVTSQTLVMVRAHSAAYPSRLASVVVVVTSNTNTLQINTTSLPEAMSGSSYTASISASGGTTPYYWSISAGSLPQGISLSASTGTLSGTTTQLGQFSFTAKVTDSSSPQQSASQQLSLQVVQSVGGNADFFVATDGNDKWTGTLPAPNAQGTDGPFATIAKAQWAVQQILQNPNGRNTPIQVMLRAGTYFIKQPLSFTSSDSGSSTLQVIWENYPSESAVISGGMQVRGWKHVTGNQWQATLPASTQYFEQLFYNGQRRLRPRLGGSLGTYYRVASPVYLNAAPPPAPAPDPNCTVYMTGSGWECFDRFVYNSSDPISATWTNLKSPYPQGDIELYDFEKWTVPKLRIKNIDAKNSIVYLTGPTTQEDAIHGFIAGHRYIVENVKDVLTEAGQWFLDQSTSPWTLTYLANSGETPSTDTVIVPQMSQVMVATGLQFVTFQGITFEHDNWTIPQAGYVSQQEEPSVPAAISCQNCQNVIFDGDTVTEITGVGFEFVTTDPKSTSANNAFQNGALFDIGVIAIRVGSPNVGSDTDANVPQSIKIQNNVIQGYSRIIPTGMGIVQGDGHDNLYTQNDLHDGYHSAIAICMPGCAPGVKNSNGVFNVTVSFNHAWDIMKGVTDDGGILYFGTGGPTWTGTGNKLLNNKVHDVNDSSVIDSDGMGGHGLYLDYQTGLVDVENNLVYRTSANAMFVSKGIGTQNTGPNTIKNNIFAYSRLGMIAEGTPTSWLQGCTTTPTLMFNFNNNIMYFDRLGTSKGTFYVQRGCTYSCGKPYNEYQNWQNNIYWRTDGGFQTDTTAFHINSSAPPDVQNDCQDQPQYWTKIGFDQWQSSANGQRMSEDGGSLIKDPQFADPTPGVDNFTLSSSPGAGFVVFDVNAPGRSNPVINPPDVADTFPTATYSITDF